MAHYQYRFSAKGDNNVNRAAIALVAAATAAAAGVGLTLASCNSDKLAGCSFAAVTTDAPSFIYLAMQDSVILRAITVADCEQVGRAVKFTVGHPALATVRTVSDTTAWFIGKAQGETMIYLTPRDYPQNRDSISLTVIAPNP